jgi:hypothetical protein
MIWLQSWTKSETRRCIQTERTPTPLAMFSMLDTGGLISMCQLSRICPGYARNIKRTDAQINPVCQSRKPQAYMADSLSFSNASKDKTTSRMYVIIAILVLATVARSIIRALSSPLRHIPGPFLARFTRLYEVYALWRYEYTAWNIKLHDIYGKPCFRPLYIQFLPEHRAYSPAWAKSV